MKKVLIVDDENLILYSLAKVLTNETTFVKTVPTGKEALREIRDHAYDLCILDICLPDTTGIDIMKTMSRIAPDGKIIMMTANEVDDEMMEQIRKHASFLLPKPFDLFQARSVICQILDGNTGSPGRDSESAPPPSPDRRKHQRIVIKKEIACTALCPDHDISNIKADLIDISIAGMGMRTEHPVNCGSAIRLSIGIDNLKGIVRWNAISEDMNRVGIEFV